MKALLIVAAALLIGAGVAIRVAGGDVPGWLVLTALGVVVFATICPRKRTQS